MSNQTIDGVPRECLERLLVDMGTAEGRRRARKELRALLDAPVSSTSDKYRAELYDEVWQKARDMGFGNVTDALMKLEKQPAPVAVVLPELNEDLRAILGRPNFTCAAVAGVLRRLGQDIRKKAEEEQAATIYWLLGHYLKDPLAWRANAESQLQEATHQPSQCHP